MGYRAYVKIVKNDGSVIEYHNVYILQTQSGFRISHDANFSDEDFIPFESLNVSACRKENPNAGCFISTAVYQFQNNPEINLGILKEFRDNTMRTKSVTTKLIDLYYRISPPIAEHLSTNKIQSEFVKKYYIDSSVKLIIKMKNAEISGNKFLSLIYETCIYVTYTLGLLTSWILFKITR